jgi:nucleoside-diphosphate-sugar epimerase
MRNDKWSIENDLDDILTATSSLWSALNGGHVFITGGTGFVGCWWLETLRHAHQTGLASVEATILTRNAQHFRERYPHLADFPKFHFVEGEVSSFEFPATRFTHVIHAATEASNRYQNDPMRLFDTVITGTRRVLALARLNGNARMLNLSSGAVYGLQPVTLERLPEAHRGAPDCSDPRAAYGEAKRCAEMMCAVQVDHYGLPVVSARVFTLIGPYMPLEEQFAAGNFLRDALAGRTVTVKGDGTPLRSYLYAADLMVWLLTLLVQGEAGRAYNVGSEIVVSVGALAQSIARIAGKGECDIQGMPVPGALPSRYLPDTRLIRDSLGVKERVSLEQAILRSARWFASTSG